ncbi:MAG: hypothetical protein ABIK93_10380, partial [candidate division WOR-3 bacterium]
YSYDANIFLQGDTINMSVWLSNFLNKSLATNWPNEETYFYYYCIYWRYLYEKFNTNQNLSEREKLAIIRDCYIQTDSVGDNPISDGAKAIDQAFLKANQNQPGKCSTFAQSIDSFATACYRKDFEHKEVYVKPYVEATYDLTKIRDDSVIRIDSIPVSFGIDYIEFITKTAQNKVGKVFFTFVPNCDSSVDFSRKFILIRRTGQNQNDSIRKFSHDTISFDGRNYDSIIFCITRLDAKEDSTNNYAYAIKAKLFPDASMDSLQFKNNKIRRGGAPPSTLPRYWKYFGAPIKITIRAGFSNKEGRGDSLKVKVKINRKGNDSLCYNESLKVFLPLDSAKCLGFPGFITYLADTFKIIAFTDLPNDQNKSNDTLIGYFVIIDSGGTNPPSNLKHGFYPLYEGFPEWPISSWVARHWSPMASCWHLRRAGQWPWGDPNNPPPVGNIDTTNYMCLRWHGRGNCYETLYTPNVVCSPYDSVKLRFRVLYWPRVTNHPCTARVVYSTDGGQTWPHLLYTYSNDDIINGCQEFKCGSASGKSQNRLDLLW